MIFRHLPAVLLIFVLLAGYSFLGLIVSGRTSSNTRHYTRMPAGKKIDAKKLFKQKCIKCHGVDGVGDTTFGEVVGAADFTDPEWQKRVGDQRLIISMTYGRGQMPSFGKKLSKEQILSLLVYVRSFNRLSMSRSARQIASL